MIDVNLLPKKLNETNFFKKNENGGCTLYSYSPRKNITIICELENFEIENDFTVNEKVIDMIRILSPITSLNITDKQITIKSTKGNYKARLLENTYMIPAFEFKDKITIDINRLKIASCFASTTGKTILTGVNINSNGDIFASDSFIAYRYLANLDLPENAYEKSITIPNEFIGFVAKEFNETVDIYFSSNRTTCMICDKNIKYVSRLLDGIFPNVNKVYQNNVGGENLVFDLEEFKQKFNIAKEVGKGFENYILLTFEDGKLIAKGNNEYEVELKPENQSIDYSFAVAYDKLIPLINNVKNSKLVFKYVDGLKPLFVEDGQNEYLILPLRKA